MKRVILRFWYLILIWFVGFSGVEVSAAESQEKADSERKVNASIADFFLGSEDKEDEMPTADTVTVIASRLPSFRTRLSDIPANVSYFPANVSYKGKEELERANERMFQDSVRDAEGAIFYDQVGNGVDTTFALRGFSEGNNIIFIVDGVRVNELDGDAVNYPLIPMNGIESIQIERGSASNIYGSGAFSGVVHITTRKPSRKKVSVFGGTEVSSFKGVRFNNGVSGTLRDRMTPLEGNVTYYFNMGRDLNKGFRSNGEWRITSLDAKLAYGLPDDSGGIHVGLKHINDAVSNPSALTVDEFHQDRGQSKNPLDGRDFRNTIIEMGADKKFWENRILTSLLAYWRINLIHFYTTSRTFPDGAFNPDTDLVTTKTRATDLVWQAGYEDEWAWFGNRSEVGVELRDASGYDLEQDAFRGNVVETSPRETERSSRPDNVSFFWRETIRLFDRVIPHAGMRHDFHWLKTRDDINLRNNLSRRWRDSSLSAGLTIKPLDQVDLFGNYSQGFRVPTISDIAPFSSGIATDLNPEESDSYETGTRFRFKDLAQAKFSFFLIDLKNEIVFDSTSITATTPFGQNVNIGKSRRSGIESRVDLIPIPELDAYGSYTWMRAYVRETAGGGTPFDGKDLGLIPRHRFTMGATARPLYRLGEWFKEFRISVEGFYTGRQFVQSHESQSQALINAAGETIDPYMIWDLMVSFEWKGKQIYFKINNLFDKHYYSRAVAATNFGSNITPTGSHLFVNPGAPREFLIGAKWEFGN